MHILFGNYSEKIVYVCCRSLRGSVDWNIKVSGVWGVSRRSLPSRERGLKYNVLSQRLYIERVAPFAGAWIEILFVYFYCIIWPGRSLRGSVDWNIIKEFEDDFGTWSLPSRERGLKYIVVREYLHLYLSLPSRERGLKFALLARKNMLTRSLPSRERGLKYFLSISIQIAIRRSLRGSVDWNIEQAIASKLGRVAPFAGAWIEISIYRCNRLWGKVAPFAGAWIEIPVWSPLTPPVTGRSLRGSVDWNVFYCRNTSGKQIVAPFAGAWIEINLWMVCRPP